MTRGGRCRWWNATCSCPSFLHLTIFENSSTVALFSSRLKGYSKHLIIWLETWNAKLPFRMYLMCNLLQRWSLKQCFDPHQPNILPNMVLLLLLWQHDDTTPVVDKSGVGWESWRSCLGLGTAMEHCSHNEKYDQNCPLEILKDTEIWIHSAGKKTYHKYTLPRETGKDVNLYLQGHEFETVGEMLGSLVEGVQQLSAAKYLARDVPGNFFHQKSIINIKVAHMQPHICAWLMRCCLSKWIMLPWVIIETSGDVLCLIVQVH